MDQQEAEVLKAGVICISMLTALSGAWMAYEFGREEIVEQP